LRAEKTDVRLHLDLDSSFPNLLSFFLLHNHVNLFDPFVLYATIRTTTSAAGAGILISGIPVYGWMMKRLATVPVPDTNRPSDFLNRIVGG